MKRKNKMIIMESEEHLHPDDEKFGPVYEYNDVKIFSRALPLSRDFNLNFIKKFAQALEAEKIDAIILSHPSGAFIIKLMLRILGKKIPVIYDAHNVESNFTQDIFSENEGYSRLEQILIPFYVGLLEKISCKYLFNHIMAVSEKDKETFQDSFKLKEKVLTVPSGCSLKHQLSSDDRLKLREDSGIGPDTMVVVFHGSYSHPANQEAFKLIKDTIAPEFDGRDVIFLVGGSGMPVVDTLNFKSIGFIEDLWNFLNIADIAIAPILRGGGTKLKLMDYLSAGLPIVTTSKGIEGIDAYDNEQVMIVNGVDQEFIAKINYLIENKDQRKQMGDKARQLALNTYDWNIIGKQLNHFLSEEISIYGNY
jgi:glycosyltransferase involved in cell wall biosynthesis